MTSIRNREGNEDQDECAARFAIVPFTLIEDLLLPCKYERSFKLMPQKVLANRYALALSLKILTSAQVSMIVERLRMPEDLRASLEREIADASWLGIGFEHSPPSCIFRIYLEFAQNLRKLSQSTMQSQESFISIRGYKWNPVNQLQRSISEYRCFPGLTKNQILDRIQTIFRTDSNRVPIDVCCEIVDIAACRASLQDLVFMEVAEENSSRKSFDVNVYPAKLPLSSIHAPLRRLRDHYSICSTTFNRLENLVLDRWFGHISGGIDKHGYAFTTVYYEAQTS